MGRCRCCCKCHDHSIQTGPLLRNVVELEIGPGLQKLFLRVLVLVHTQVFITNNGGTANVGIIPWCVHHSRNFNLDLTKLYIKI